MPACLAALPGSNQTRPDWVARERAGRVRGSQVAQGRGTLCRHTGGLALTPDLVFSVCNLAVMPFWLLLAVAPRWAGTQRAVHAIWFPIVLGLVYLTAFASSPGAPEGAGFGSLRGVMLLFTIPEVVVAGWVHYLVFDLFVGAWIVRDAQRRGVPHLAVVPCLVGTLMLGPVGLLAYLTLRLGMRRETSLVEEIAG